MFKRVLMASAISFAAMSAHANETLLTENFDDISTLSSSGWIEFNLSVPVGDNNGWFQGGPNFFEAQSGAPDSYIAANYLNAGAGGTISNFLLSPEFSMERSGSVTFWARAEIVDGFSDVLSYGLSGSPATAVTLTGEWTQYTLDFAGLGAGATGHLAFNYLGDADTSNYIGIDTFSVTAVPEPSTWLMLGLGLTGLAIRGRRLAARS
jgi:hypothetical protein